MADEKKFTAQEAALAVLKKTSELLAKSDLAKAETGHEKGINRQSVSNTASGVSAAGGRLRTANKYGSDMQSSRDHALQDTKDMHRETLGQMKDMRKPNLDKSEEGAAPMKGHIKLAKFMGRMEHKRGQKQGATEGHEKGVHTHNHEGPGNSPAGSFASSAVKGNTSIPKDTLNSYAKEEHTKVLGEMKSMPKPKLPG